MFPVFYSVPVVSPSDSVALAAKMMREYRVNSVVVMTGSMLLGIFTYVFVAKSNYAIDY